jgi:DNA topoisomerase-2
MADDRKNWLTTYNPDNAMDFDFKEIRYKDFIDKELIQFSIYDNQRSIPHIMDGLKPGKRKILYGCFFKKFKRRN